MKKTDLERLKAARIADQMKQAGAPARYGKDSAPESRRERRRRDGYRALTQGMVAVAAGGAVRSAA